jgi:hypothetical protein
MGSLRSNRLGRCVAVAATAGCAATLFVLLVVPAASRPDEQAESLRVACRSNLKQYALALIMYLQDYDERYPPTVRAADVQKRVMPYVRSRSVFTCPATKSDYLPNPALNYEYLPRVTTPNTMLMLRDAIAHRGAAGGSFWAVAFADGHVAESTTEPKLGKPAPTPEPLSRAQVIAIKLKELRAKRARLDAGIRALEKELARTKQRSK